MCPSSCAVGTADGTLGDGCVGYTTQVAVFRGKLQHGAGHITMGSGTLPAPSISKGTEETKL